MKGGEIGEAALREVQEIVRLACGMIPKSKPRVELKGGIPGGQNLGAIVLLLSQQR